MYKTLPIRLKYDDKVDLVQKLLKVYSVVFEKKMTNRNLDLLTVCMLEDVNAEDFRKTVIRSVEGIDNERHVNTELHRLRKDGFLHKDSYMKDNLEENLQKIKDTLNDETQIALYLAYDKKE